MVAQHKNLRINFHKTLTTLTRRESKEMMAIFLPVLSWRTEKSAQWCRLLELWEVIGEPKRRSSPASRAGLTNKFVLSQLLNGPRLSIRRKPGLVEWMLGGIGLGNNKFQTLCYLLSWVECEFKQSLLSLHQGLSLFQIPLCNQMLRYDPP